MALPPRSSRIPWWSRPTWGRTSRWGERPWARSCNFADSVAASLAGHRVCPGSLGQWRFSWLRSGPSRSVIRRRRARPMTPTATRESLTLPQLLVAQAHRFDADKVALREKKYGIWQEVSWRHYADQVRAVCLGLVQLGLAQGDKVALICGNRPAWLYVELAAQSAGVIPVGIAVDSGHDQVKGILDHSEARFDLVEDQEQADKVLNAQRALPRLERVIVDDMRGLEGYQDHMLVELAVVAETGRELVAREPHRYEELLDRGRSVDVALLAYSQEMPGPSKAAMITHRGLVAMAANVTQVDPVRETDQVFSLLPFVWVGEQLISVAI